MTTIYIIRHGETESNLRHACVGHKDVPLNETGYKQAEELAHRLKNAKLDAAYSSPLNRAIETAKPLMKMGVPVTMNFALIERDYGKWDDMTFEEIETQNPEEYKKWMSDFTGYSVPEGESSKEVQKRVGAFMKKIIDSHRGQRIAVVTHLGTARHILSYLLGLTTEQSWLFTFGNAKYAVVDIDDDNKGLLKGLNL